MDRNEALTQLRKIFARARKGSPRLDVYTMITHVSRSGMSRHVRVFCVRDGRIVELTGYVARALNYPRARGSQWDIVVGGCGFDAGHQVVYDLSWALYHGKRKDRAGYVLNHVRM